MKMKALYKAALPLATMLTLASCNEDSTPAQPQGKLDLSSLGVEVDEATSRAVTDVSAYLVDICKEGETLYSYTYSQMPGVVSLAPGQYTVNVRSHELQKAEFDRPYYTGVSETFTIEDGKIQKVDPVKCTFGALKVSVVFGPKLRSKMGDDVEVKVVANDEGQLTFRPAEEHEGGYFATLDGSATLVATFTGTVNGVKETFSRTYTDIAAGQHRRITYECGAEVPVPEQPSGSASPSGISIDITMDEVTLESAANPGKEETVDPGQRPGTLDPIDDPETPDDPTPPAPPVQDEPIAVSGDFENGQIYYTDELVAIGSAKVIVDTKEPIKSFAVNIQSSFLDANELEGVGLSDNFDLADPGKYEEKLSDLKFPFGNQVAGQKHVEIDIIEFMSLLEIGGTSESKFTMTITDEEGNVQAISFNINVK